MDENLKIVRKATDDSLIFVFAVVFGAQQVRVQSHNLISGVIPTFDARSTIAPSFTHPKNSESLTG